MVKKEKRESGPSRKDVYGWKRIWCPTNFGGTETEPRKVLANFIVKIWKEEFFYRLHWSMPTIPLDRNLVGNQ